MATTLPGSPYVESSDLVANYPAVSEALAERVDLVGVLPFADSAARTTAIPTPTDGQYSYLQDTNSTEYYNGTAWVAAGVTPGLTHINTTAFSSVSSVSLNSVFTSTYTNYFILANKIIGTGSADFNIRLRVSGVDASGANYTYQEGVFTGSTAAAGRTTNSSAAKVGTLRTDANGGDVSFNIFRPQLAETTNYATQVVYEPNSGAVLNFVGGFHSVATAYDGITFLAQSGTMSGTVVVYGYKKD